MRTMKDARTGADLARLAARAVGGRSELVARGSHAFPAGWAQTARFAEIGQIATGIIHEINNPVACLCSNVSLLFECLPGLAARRANGKAPGAEPDADDRQGRVRQILADMATSAELIKSISGNLKSLAYSAHDAPEATDLPACIEAALRVAGHELKYRLRVEKELGPLPRLLAYPGLLIQVFLNLFVNAAQAIDGDGVLRIRAHAGEGGVVVEVGDTGRGIAPDHLAKIFRPFFTTKPRGVGLGLGLSICKRIIDRHGGKLEVSSPPGAGTIFRITLPLEARRERPSSLGLGGAGRPQGARTAARPRIATSTEKRSHGA